MAGSAVVGVLRVLLSANTAEFDAAMAAAATSAKGLTKSFGDAGRQLQNVGMTLTKALTVPLVGLGVASAKAAIDFESSFAGIRKTVDGVVDSSGELTAAGKEIQQAMRNLAKDIPVSVNELNKLGESAGELGISKERVVDFTKVMAQLGVTTNLTAQDAASAIARIQNIFGAAGVDTDRFASTLVALGNAGASTEKEIVEMAQRIAGAGHAVGLTEAQVLAFASTLASVGINAEAGGSAISRVFLKINDAVAKGGTKLTEFARVAGMSAADFKKAFETDAAGATNAFITGLGRLKASGENVNATIEGLTGKNIILKDTLLRVAGAGDLLSKNLALSNQAWQDNTALTNEAAQRFKTTEAQLTILWNRIKDVGITIGNALLPAINSTVQGMSAMLPLVDGVAKAFAALPGPVQLSIVGIAGVAAAIGPVLILLGQMSSGVATVTALFTKKGLAARALGAAVTEMGAATAIGAQSTGLLATAIGVLTNPITLAVAGLGLLAFAIYKIVTAQTDLEKSFHANASSFNSQTKSLDDALKTYDELRNKQNLTTEETAKLEKATRQLAEASGLSKDAFEKEAAGSSQVTDALRVQLSARRELMAQAVTDARQSMAQIEAQINQARTDLAKVLSGTATKAETSGGTGGGGVLVRGLSAEERIAEIKRLNGTIDDLKKKAGEARDAYQQLVGPLTAAQTAIVDKSLGKAGEDVKTGWQGVAGLFLNGVVPALQKTGTAAKGTKSDLSELAALNAKYAEDLKSIGVSGFKNLIAEHEQFGTTLEVLAKREGIAETSLKKWVSTAKDIAKDTREATGYIDKFNKSADTLEKELAAAAAAGVPMSIVLEEFGKQIEDVTHKAPIFGKAIGDATKEASAALNVEKMNAYVDALSASWEHVQNAMTEGSKKVFGNWMEEEKKVRDASTAGLAKQVMDHQKYEDAVIAMGLRGTDRELFQIDRARDAAIKSLGERTVANARWYDQNRRLIDEFYAHEQRLALGTADTIVERMNRQGVQTKAQLQQMADDAKRDYEQMKDSGLYTYEELAAAAARAAQLQRKAADSVFDRWMNTFDRIAATVATSFAQIADSTDGSVSRIARTISVIAKGWTDASKAVDDYRKAAEAGDKAGMAMAGLEGIATLASTSDPRGKTDTQTILGSGVAGAKMGSVAGPYGMAAGFIIGALVGWWRSAHAEWKKIKAEIIQTLGDDFKDISQALSQQIADLEKTISGGTHQQRREEAVQLATPQLIDEAGGLNSKNLAEFEQAAASLFTLWQTGGHNAVLASNALNESIGRFTAYAETAGGMWDPVLKAMISQSKELGMNLDAVGKAIDGQIAKLSNGLATAVAGSTVPTTKAFDALLKGLPEAEAKALADGFKKAQEGGFSGSLADFFSQQAKLYQTAPEGSPDLMTWFSGDTLDKFKKLGEEAQPAFDRLTRVALASFNTIIASGKTAVEAMALIGASVDALIDEHDKLGLAGGAAFDQLARFRTLTKDNEALVASVGGLNDTMVALSNLGGLNIDVLADLEAQGLDAFAKLQAAGFTENEALKQMVPFLENVIKAHKDLGIPIDENTQKLIDQAEAQGLLSDETMSTNDILMEGFAALIKAVGGELPAAFQKMAKSAQTEAGKVTDAINKIPSKKTVTIEYNEEGYPTTDTTGVGSTELPPGYTPPERQYPTDPNRRYARGGLVHGDAIGDAMGRLIRFPVPSGDDKVPILAQEDEGILNRLAMSRMTSSDLTRLNSGVEPGRVFNAQMSNVETTRNEGDIHVNVEFSGTVKDKETADYFAIEIAKQIRRDGKVREVWAKEVTNLSRRAG